MAAAWWRGRGVLVSLAVPERGKPRLMGLKMGKGEMIENNKSRWTGSLSARVRGGDPDGAVDGGAGAFEYRQEGERQPSPRGEISPGERGQCPHNPIRT
jgi:hypothetical protein